MTVDDVVAHFGSVVKTAEFFNLSPEAVYQWKKRPGELIPKSRAMELSLRLGGEFIFDPKTYSKTS